MVRSTLKKILIRLGVMKAPPARPAASPPPRPAARPAPRPAPRDDDDHGHSHGHSHDHGHDHDHRPPPPPAAQDHGHEHPHAHDHEPPAPKPAAKAAAMDHGHDHPHAHEHEPAEPPAKPAAKGKKKKVDVLPEDTPNPNARKFSASVKVVEKGSLSFTDAAQAESHPLGKALFALGGVRGVFAVNDFVTVTKDDATDWSALTPRVVAALKDHL